MTRISRHLMLMEVAQVVAKRGTCGRKQVGVIVARQGRILVSGYNGNPAGMAHCAHTSEELEAVGPICSSSVHAEANAIAFAAKYGISLDEGTLYTTCSPCLNCAKLIINSGIKVVISGEYYHDRAGEDLLAKAGINAGVLQQL